MRKCLRYAVLALLAWLLLNAHILGMLLFGIGMYPSDFRWILYALSGSVWLVDVIAMSAAFPVPLLPLRLLILAVGLAVWFRRPDLLTATILALAGMFGGPFAVWALGYPEFSLPIAGMVFVVGFLLHYFWSVYADYRAARRS